jgi:hypothetical protein
MENEIVVKAIAKEAGKEGAQEAINAMLITFGIAEDDHKEVRRDFEHLRRWRLSVEQAESYTFKAIVTAIVGGFLGAVWLGVKTYLGK